MGIICFIVIAVSFVSLMVPLRLVVTVLATLCFCSGMVVLVYGEGMLTFLGIYQFGQHEFSWISFMTTTPVIVGLSLDYDVFLMTRIFEFRLDGWFHKSSILLGLQSTGSIITIAGIIMSTAFGGLMIAKCLILVQWAFIMVTAVLLDTFVIRTILVPILMSYAGHAAWWPGNLPVETKTVLPEEESEVLT